MGDTDNWSARSSLGGSLRPGDPRRFYIEAMVGAMRADGVVDQRELATLYDMLERHDLFAGLPSASARMLVDMSTDAIDFAGDATARIPVIASKLRWRIDRLAAFAMACEVCGADEDLDANEEAYLAELRAGLRMTEREQRELLAAARAGRAMTWLADEITRTRARLPQLAQLLIMCRRAAGVDAADEVDDIVDFLLSLRDHDLTRDDAAELVEELAGETRAWPGARDHLPALAAALDLPADRHWIISYLFAYDLTRERRGWQNNPVARALADELALEPATVDAMREDARRMAQALSAS